MTAAPLYHGPAPVLANDPLARDTFRLRLHAPPLAAAIRPGQFLMLRAPDRCDPLLGRAFALYETVTDDQGRPTGVDIAYTVVGKMTRLLAGLAAGDTVDVWGPLGKPFPDYRGVDHLVCIAGGIGQTPMLALIKRALGQKGYAGAAATAEVHHASLYYGVRSAAYFAGLDDFAATRAPIHLATDDGSRGFAGFVTQLVDQHHRDGQLGAGQRWVGCGPEPMMHALAKVAERHGIGLDLSLETPMACGVGVCFSCVTKVKDGDGWDYRRVCVEGPVFDAAGLVW
jgi:dihydroorotate dehydrogenase electron transfer subunit